MDTASINQSLGQFQQRISSVEDLLRRNEGSVTAMLSRMKAAEIAVSGVHKATSDLIPKDMRGMADDQATIRRRVDTVEQSIRPLISESVGILDNDVRTRMGISEERAQREVSDLAKSIQSQLAREHEATSGGLIRLSDGQQAMGNELRLVGQDSKWACEGVRDLMKRHTEFSTAAERRMGGIDQSITITRQQLTELVSTTVNRAVAEVREEMRGMHANHMRLQSSHDDLGGIVSRLRDDTVKALSQAATNMRSLDDTTQSLETLLKAEVKTRQARVEELGDRLSFVENNMATQANVSDSKLAALDDEIGRAIMDVHRTAQADTKAQLDRAWRNINELRDQLTKVQASQRAHAMLAVNTNNGGGGSNSSSPSKAGRFSPSRAENTAADGADNAEGAAAFPFLDAADHNSNGAATTSATAQRRLQLQWQADIAVMKNELLAAFDGDLAKSRQSVVLLMEQQEALAVTVGGLERDVAAATNAAAQQQRRNAGGADADAAAADGSGAAAAAAPASPSAASHDDLQQLEWRLTAMVKASGRDMAAMRADIEQRVELLGQRQRGEHLSPIQSPTKRANGGAEVEEGADSSTTANNADSIIDEDRYKLLGQDLAAAVSQGALAKEHTSTDATGSGGGGASAEQHAALQQQVKSLDERTSTTFVEVDYRLQDLEDRTNTLHTLQKRLERTWNEDQEHLEACVLKLRDDLKLLAGSLGVVGPSNAAGGADEEQDGSADGGDEAVAPPPPPPPATEQARADAEEEAVASPPAPAEAEATNDAQEETPRTHQSPRSSSSSSGSSASRSSSRSTSSSRSSDSSYTPVETHDVGTGTMSVRPTPTPPPAGANAAADPNPKPPTTPKGDANDIRHQRKAAVAAAARDDEDDMGFSPPSTSNHRGGGGKRASKTAAAHNIPVVDADLNLEGQGGGSDAVASAAPASNASASPTGVDAVKASPKASPRSTAASPASPAKGPAKKAPPPPAAAKTKSSLTPRGGVGAPAAASPASPASLNGTSNKSLPALTSAPQSSANAKPAGSLGGTLRNAPSNGSGTPRGGMVKGGAKSAYDHAAPGWARPPR